jgi:hypothetical protein
MNIVEIYQQYQIMPQLQLHQLRVAAVAQMLARAIDKNLNQEAIIKACLLHDMGNIIKFDLRAMALPHFLEPAGQEYWLKVQTEFLNKYGNDEHEATIQIARELNVSKYVIELIDSIGFNMLAKNYVAKDLAKMICEYADNRVAPLGIVSLEQRLHDLEKRYAHKFPAPAETKFRQQAQEIARLSEQYLFSLTHIKPSEITDEALDDTISKLRDFSI